MAAIATTTRLLWMVKYRKALKLIMNFPMVTVRMIPLRPMRMIKALRARLM